MAKVSFDHRPQKQQGKERIINSPYYQRDKYSGAYSMCLREKAELGELCSCNTSCFAAAAVREMWVYSLEVVVVGSDDLASLDWSELVAE